MKSRNIALGVIVLAVCGLVACQRASPTVGSPEAESVASDSAVAPMPAPVEAVPDAAVEAEAVVPPVPVDADWASDVASNEASREIADGAPDGASDEEEADVLLGDAYHLSIRLGPDKTRDSGLRRPGPAPPAQQSSGSRLATPGEVHPEQECYALYDFRARDECTIRRNLALPDEMQLVCLDSVPNDSDLLQREGLRIDATFEMPPAGRDAFQVRIAATWKSSRVPALVGSFRDPPPATRLSHEDGYYMCETYVYRPNSNIIAGVHSCAASPSEFDAYLLATYDESTGRLRAWFKHYF